MTGIVSANLFYYICWVCMSIKCILYILCMNVSHVRTMFVYCTTCMYYFTPLHLLLNNHRQFFALFYIDDRTLDSFNSVVLRRWIGVPLLFFASSDLLVVDDLALLYWILFVPNNLFRRGVGAPLNTFLSDTTSSLNVGRTLASVSQHWCIKTT